MSHYRVFLFSHRFLHNWKKLISWMNLVFCSSWRLCFLLLLFQLWRVIWTFKDTLPSSSCSITCQKRHSSTRTWWMDCEMSRNAASSIRASWWSAEWDLFCVNCKVVAAINVFILVFHVFFKIQTCVQNAVQSSAVFGVLVGQSKHFVLISSLKL